jgi:transposase-like protein
LRGDFDKSALLRNAVRLIIEEALEAEVTDGLGRGYYEHGEPAGYRNGHRLGRLKTAEGIVAFAVPPVTGTAEPWASAVKQALWGRTEELERQVVDMYDLLRAIRRYGLDQKMSMILINTYFQKNDGSSRVLVEPDTKCII